MIDEPRIKQALEDEEMRKLLKPTPTSEDILQILTTLRLPSSSSPMIPDPSNEKKRKPLANEELSVEVLKELDSYDDANFLVEIGGVKHLLKVQNGVESQAYIDELKNSDSESPVKLSAISLLNQMMKHVSSHGIMTNCPVSVVVVDADNKNGDATFNNVDVTLHDLPVVSKEHSPRKLAVRLLSWVDGHTMGSCKCLPIEKMAEAGEFLGKLSIALADMVPGGAAAIPPESALMRFHAWDVQHTDKSVSRFVDYLQDPRKKELVNDVMRALKEDLLPIKDELRVGIIHNDFNDANIILDANGNVNGVIDFGDSLCTWIVADISIAMAYASLSAYGKTKHSLAAAAAMLRGYNKICPLTEIERKHLRLLISCRLACSYTMGYYSYTKNPENEYLLLHSEPASNALELIWGGACDAASIDRLFGIACCAKATANNPDCSDIAIPDPSVVDLFSLSRVMDAPRQPAKTTADRSVITFVTGNKKKLEEVSRLLSDGNDELPFALINCKIDLPELQGEPMDIAREKCEVAVKNASGPVIVEDTSLCFNALNSLPGPYIKWFLDKCGLDGLNKLLSGHEDKSAYAQTIVAFCPKPGAEVVLFDGRINGKIVPARGILAFGWDPIFEPDEAGGKTFAEMEKTEKDAISHRCRAFALLREYLRENKEILL
uniref:Inosine triphosphate pyrophosphatase n=1 Tax=Leptocylindrus danicus TaxID=163516 RepID=A0A7S2P1E9_9STRA